MLGPHASPQGAQNWRSNTATGSFPEGVEKKKVSQYLEYPSPNVLLQDNFNSLSNKAEVFLADSGEKNGEWYLWKILN